jgi:signal recognition particle receptor subunit beta
VLRGADGVIFVADSLEVRREKNMLALKDLQENLKEYGLSIFKVPLVMQYNKRDLDGENISIMDLKKMEHDLNRQLKVPSFPGAALKGDGVGKTLHACLKLVMQAVQNEFT